MTPLPWLPASVCTCTTVGETRDTAFDRSSWSKLVMDDWGVEVVAATSAAGGGESSPVIRLAETPPTAPAARRATPRAASRPVPRGPRGPRGRPGAAGGSGARGGAPEPPRGGSAAAGGAGLSGGSPGPRSGRGPSGGSSSVRARGSRGGRSALTTEVVSRIRGTGVS